MRDKESKEKIKMVKENTQDRSHRHHRYLFNGELAPLGVGSGSSSPLLPPLGGVSAAGGLGVMSLSSSSSSRLGVASLRSSSGDGGWITIADK